MEIQGTEAKVQFQEKKYKLDISYKEPTLTIKLGGKELATVDISGGTKPGLHGANDVLVLAIAVSTPQGEIHTVPVEVNIPDFLKTTDEPADKPAG